MGIKPAKHIHEHYFKYLATKSVMLNLSLKSIFLAVLALLLATCRGTGKDLVIQKVFSLYDIDTLRSNEGLKIKARGYTLIWKNRISEILPPIVTVNGVALSRFDGMHSISDVSVLQFPNETLYVFEVWCGGIAQNSQLMLVRISDQIVEEAVSVMGPTTLDDQFNRMEITPIKEKGLMVGSLFNFYIDDDKVAVYRYSSSEKFELDELENNYTTKGDKSAVYYGYSPGYLTKVQPAAGWGGIWYRRYTATKEAGIAEVIAAALEYENLDPEAREFLAGVIVSEYSARLGKIHYSVNEISYKYGSDDTASIKLYISSEGVGKEGMSLDSSCVVEIRLSRMNEISEYVIQSVTLASCAG